MRSVQKQAQQRRVFAISPAVLLCAEDRQCTVHGSEAGRVENAIVSIDGFRHREFLCGIELFPERPQPFPREVLFNQCDRIPFARWPFFGGQ